MKNCGETSRPRRGETDHKLTKLLPFYFRSNTSNKTTNIKYELNELKVITQFLSTSYSMIIIAMKIHKKENKTKERLRIKRSAYFYHSALDRRYEKTVPLFKFQLHII